DAGQSRHGGPVRDRRPPRLGDRGPPPAAADPAPPRLEPARRRVAPEPGRCPTPSSGTLSTPSTTPGPPRPAAQGTAVPAAPSNRTAPDKAPGPSAPATTESVAVTDTPTLVAPLRLFLLTFLFAVPFWILGFLVESPDAVPMAMPVSALMFVCPAIAATLLACLEGRSAAVRSLWGRVLVPPRPRRMFGVIP